jgi:hypothetical protein
MKILSASVRSRARQRGWALLATMGLSAAGLMVMAGVLDWADQNASNTARNNEYFATCYAAESATQKVLATMSEQFNDYGQPTVDGNMSSYPSSIPTAADGSYWTNYQFSAGGVAGQIVVTNTDSSASNILGAPYTGLTLKGNTYEIIATARNINSQYQILVTVGQKITLGNIPLFQFAIFYQNLLEIEPNAPMTVTGTVHGNSDIYAAPHDGLWFSNIVTSSGTITTGPTTATDPIDFAGLDLTSVAPLNLPVGVDTTGANTNVSDNVYGILQIPTNGQSATSTLGQNLLYNQADLIVVISNNSVTVTSGAKVNGQATVLSSSDWGAFMSTNGSFYDARDGLTVNPVVIDVSNLVVWSSNNTTLRPVLASARGNSQSDVQSIYVADMRTTTNAIVTTTYTMATNFVTNSTPTTSVTLPPSYIVNGAPIYAYVFPPVPPYTFAVNYTTNVLTRRVSIASYTYCYIGEIISTNSMSLTNYAVTTQPGVVLSNGAVLPANGLSVATPDPAYIVGDWNVKNSFASGAPSDAGLQDTAYTRPSGVYADAVTILSSAWNPANSTLPLTARTAVNDTVNAALLTGNVATSVNGSTTNYSGGVENLPRYLENWNSATSTYNGSMVCMFNSHIAKQPYQQPGYVFNPPTRNWAFDNNFSDPSKDPPMMPSAKSVQRSQWVLLAPNATSF